MKRRCRNFGITGRQDESGTLRVCASFALALLLSGCAATRPVLPPGSMCVVNVPRAPFYKYGPAQSFGADMLLNFGTRVTVIERSMSYCRVMTENGFTGYVADDQLDPVPAEAPPKKEPAAVVTNRKLPRVFSAPIKRSNVAPTPGDPLFDMTDVPLPTRDEPAVAPKPSSAPQPAAPPADSQPPAEPLPTN